MSLYQRQQACHRFVPNAVDEIYFCLTTKHAENPSYTAFLACQRKKFPVTHFWLVNLNRPIQHKPRQNFVFDPWGVCFPNQLEVNGCMIPKKLCCSLLWYHFCSGHSATVKHPKLKTSTKEFNFDPTHHCGLDHRALIKTVRTFPHILLLCVLYVVHLHWVFTAAVTGASSVDQALLGKRVKDFYGRL